MKRYPRTGYLALQPQALFEVYVEDVAPRSVRMVSGFPVVEIVGPLVHHPDTPFDSYDAIHARVAEACTSESTHVILKIDSPGGDVSGCLDTARELRAMCAAAGKQLVAFVDGQATSAAYALACAASSISVPATGIVGSIGIIDVRVDTTAIDKAMGLRFAITTSGARKADGNPHTAITDEELAIRQSKVDSLAQEFFALVAETRGVSIAAVAALQAGTLHGVEAVKARLADRVQSFDEMVAALAAAPTEGPAMSMKDAIAAIRAAAEGDDAEEAKQAKSMLAALDAEAGEDDKPKDDTEAEAEDAPSDDDDEEKKKKKDDEEKAKAAAASVATSAVSAGTAGNLAAIVDQQGKELAELRARHDNDTRRSLLDSRPDLDKSLRQALAASPLAEVQRILAAMPKKTPPKPAGTAAVSATRGEGQGAGTSQPTTSEAMEMDARMGMSSLVMGVRREGNAMVFGAMPAHLAQKSAGNEGGK